MADKYFARRDLPGYNGRPYDRGQVIETFGSARNDEKLERLGYVAKVARNTTLFECGECGGKFVDETTRNSHAAFRHKERFGDEFAQASAEEERLEKREQMLEQVAPLNLENTKASREARA